jgi:hypothetical protein
MATETGAVESAEDFVDTLLDAGMETSYGEILEYTPEKMVDLIRQDRAAVRRAALEEAAQLIEAQGSQPNTITTPDSPVELGFHGLYPHGPHAMMAAEIRALLAQEKADG